MSTFPRPIVALCVLFVSLPALSLAWGWKGHHITGYLAEKELEPEVRAAIDDLLDGESMASVSAWADRVRPRRPETAPFHYVNGPRGVLVPREEDFLLPEGNVYTAVLGYSELVADETLPRQQRREALKFLIHFIGDIHQPLHCGFSDDLGGNTYTVLHEGRRRNIHRIWDTEILGDYLEMEVDEAAAIIYEKYTDEERAQWVSVGDPRDWVIEARRPIFAGLYPPQRVDIEGEDEPIAIVDDLYMEIWQPIAEAQIARTGSRLAATLNAIFTTGTSPFDPLPIELPLLPDPEEVPADVPAEEVESPGE
ncbi:MAG: hypothetical protein JJU11_08625 [Candidatus Sumerlaeia bacterium]|nr:hypothetical protein [Candidatus Sumerlaeia bacterium]